MRILWKSLIDFFNHDGPMLAGSITCFFMMSIAPFFLLLVTIFGSFLGEHQEFYDFLSARVADFFPKATSGVMSELQKILTYRRIDMLSLGLYAYFSYQLYFAFERAVNIIFESSGKRSFFKSLLLSLFVALLLIAILILFFGAKVSLSLLEPPAGLFPGLNIGEITRLFMGYILPLALVFVTTSVFFTILPRMKIRVLHAVTGALITTLLLEGGKHVFTYYVAIKVSQFGMIYGSLTAVVLFLLWIFYAACIFLLGAQVVRNLETAD